MSKSRRRLGLDRRVPDLRLEWRELYPADLNDVDRRELRLFFKELAMLVRAKPEADRKTVFPPLPAVHSAGPARRR